MRLADSGTLTGAEQAVVDGLGSGLTTKLGDGKLPGAGAGDDRRVRAGLIRWLALGAPGEDGLALHEKGLGIMGALVVSDGQADPEREGESTPGLDLEGCALARDLALVDCRFQHAPLLHGARVQSLFLNGSALPGLNAERLKARGSVFLRDAHATGAVRLLNARIGGDLECDGGRFENPRDEKKKKTRPGSIGKALNAEGARVTGALFWRRDDDGNNSSAKGVIDLTAAEIGYICDDPACWPAPGDLVLDRCRYGAFTGTGTPVSATERIRWLDLQTPARLGAEFWPQPWEQCAHVLREMGHAEDARAVLIAKEERQRRAKRRIVAARLTGARLRKRRELAKSEKEARGCRDEANTAIAGFEFPDDPRAKAIDDQPMSASAPRQADLQEKTRDAGAILARGEAKAARLGTRGADWRLTAQSAVTYAYAWLTLAGLRLRDGLLRVFLAYGHRPFRALSWLVALWIVGAVVFAVAWGDGGFKPNSAVILRGPEWVQCTPGGARRGDHPSTLACYLAQPEAAGYPAFNALLYSADTLVPVVDLEVQAYWLPDARAAPWARWYLWAQIAAGWGLTLLAVAGFSGLVQNRAGRE